ncbi:hypothetical protein [Erwinia phage Gungnir39]|nr:hypothetical protein [Erwinia phage Gungnir39]
MNNELAKLKELAQTQDLLIANGQLTTYLLRQLADNEIDSDCFSVVSECESYGKETDAELSITDFAVRAACYVDALIERLEAAEAQVKELTADLDKESEIRHRIHEELNAIKGEQLPVAWISERNLKNLGKQFSVYVKHEPVMVRPVALYTHPAVLPVIVLKGGSLKSDGNIWYKSETVVQLIRAAGLEVKP